MNEHYPPLLVSATADGILAVLCDEHRQQCTHDHAANPDISLSHNSTIAEWRDACDLLPWAKLAKGMNAYWSVDIPTTQWREVLEPSRERRLGAVCELLARHAKLPRVRPANLLGGSCASAGAFLTIRSYLADAGADVNALAPSTPLHEYTRRYARVFLGPISQLAPGALPLVKIRTPVYDAFVCGMLIACAALVLGLFADLPAVALVSGLALATCYAGVWIVGLQGLPKSVEFLGLSTFRDLAKIIAADIHVTSE